MITLSVIIVSFNTQELTLKCINSIFKHYEKEIEKKEFEIILVDNNSDDNTVKLIKEKFKNALIIENKENYGFSKGNNIGAKKAQGEFLLFLNSDTYFENSTINGMISFLKEKNEIGVLGGRIIDKNGNTQKSAGNFFKLYNVFWENKFSPRTLQEVDWIEGSFFIIRQDLFNKIGGFDENFFMYVEDMELCYRIEKLGYKVYFYKNSYVVHLGQGSSDRTFAVVSIYKGMMYFYKKHKSTLEYSVLKMLLMIKAVGVFFLGLLIGNSYLVKTYKEAFISTI